MNYIFKSSRETKQFGKLFSYLLIRIPPRKKRARVIGISGDLGAGKTTFVQGFITAIIPRAKVTSPTFLIARVYPLLARKKHIYKNIYHLDLYRITHIKELQTIGFEEMIANPYNIVLIEWPEKAKNIMLKTDIYMKFSHIKNEKERALLITTKEKKITTLLKKSDLEGKV